MIIKNNRLGLMGVGYDSATNKCVLTLLPGPNEVSVELWNKIKAHPMIGVYLQEGLLEEIADEKKPNAPAEVLLAKLPPKEAEAVVAQTVQVEILERWFKAEKRPKIKKAIEKQIAEIKAPPEYREGGGIAKEA